MCGDDGAALSEERESKRRPGPMDRRCPDVCRDDEAGDEVDKRRRSDGVARGGGPPHCVARRQWTRPLVGGLNVILGTYCGP